MLQFFSRSHCRGRLSEWAIISTSIALFLPTCYSQSISRLHRKNFLSDSGPKMLLANSSIGPDMQGAPVSSTGVSPGTTAGITFAVLISVFVVTFFIYRKYHQRLKRLPNSEIGMLQHHNEEDYRRFQSTALPLRLPLPVAKSLVPKKFIGKHNVYADSGIGESTIMSSSFSHHRNSSISSNAISEVIRMEHINDTNRKRQSSLPMILPPPRKTSLPAITVPNHARHSSLPGALLGIEPLPQNHGVVPQQKNENPAQSSPFPFPPPPTVPPPTYKIINTSFTNIQVQAKQQKPYSDIPIPPLPSEDKPIRRATLSLRNSILHPFKDKRDDSTSQSQPPPLPPSSSSSPLPPSLLPSSSRPINRSQASIPVESLLQTPTIGYQTNESRLSTASEGRRSVASMQWYGFDDSMDMRDVEPSRKSKFFVTNMRDSSVISSQRSSWANSRRSSGRSSVNRQLVGLGVTVGKIEEDEISLKDGRLSYEKQEGDEEEGDEEGEENEYEIEERPLRITDFIENSDYFSAVPPSTQSGDPTFVLTPTLQLHQPDPFGSLAISFEEEGDMNDQFGEASPVPSSSRRPSYQETRINAQSRNSFGIFEEERNASKSSLTSIGSGNDDYADDSGELARRDSEPLDYRYIRTRSMAPEIQWQPSQIAAFDILTMESKLYPDISGEKVKEDIEESEDSDSEVEGDNYLQAINTKLLLSNPDGIQLPLMTPVSPLRLSGFGITESESNNLRVPSPREEVRTSVLETWEAEGYGAALYSE